MTELLIQEKVDYRKILSRHMRGLPWHLQEQLVICNKMVMAMLLYGVGTVRVLICLERMHAGGELVPVIKTDMVYGRSGVIVHWKDQSVDDLVYMLDDRIRDQHLEKILQINREIISNLGKMRVNVEVCIQDNLLISYLKKETVTMKKYEKVS